MAQPRSDIAEVIEVIQACATEAWSTGRRGPELRGVLRVPAQADLFAAWHRTHHTAGGEHGEQFAAGVVLAFPSPADRSRRETAE